MRAGGILPVVPCRTSQTSANRDLSQFGVIPTLWEAEILAMSIGLVVPSQVSTEELENDPMNRLGLTLISEIMGWTDEGVDSREHDWLDLMSAIKFDGYSDFRAGSGFVENLAIWLKQFAPEDRPTAYDFVKKRLVYISGAEMQRLIEGFIPEIVTPYLRRLAAAKIGIAPHEVWGSAEGAAAFKSALRRSLFVGLSDGARIDILRRANAGRLSQEQIVPMMNIDPKKWVDLNDELQGDEGEDAKFDRVYLIDDFTASGTTFIREVEGKWKGKLKKFNDLVVAAREDARNGGKTFPIADKYGVHIHHYISTQQAREALDARVETAHEAWSGRDYDEVSVTEGLLMPPSLKLQPDMDGPMLALCDKYYDNELYLRLKKHCDEAGQSDMKRGYANCALPLILEHNTPNNSIPLLWAETSGGHGHKMSPLFRRRDRHG